MPGPGASDTVFLTATQRRWIFNLNISSEEKLVFIGLQALTGNTGFVVLGLIFTVLIKKNEL